MDPSVLAVVAEAVASAELAAAVDTPLVVAAHTAAVEELAVLVDIDRIGLSAQLHLLPRPVFVWSVQRLAQMVLQTFRTRCRSGLCRHSSSSSDRCERRQLVVPAVAFVVLAALVAFAELAAFAELVAFAVPALALER